MASHLVDLARHTTQAFALQLRSYLSRGGTTQGPVRTHHAAPIHTVVYSRGFKTFAGAAKSHSNGGGKSSNEIIKDTIVYRKQNPETKNANKASRNDKKSASNTTLTSISSTESVMSKQIKKGKKWINKASKKMTTVTPKSSKRENLESYRPKLGDYENINMDVGLNAIRNNVINKKTILGLSLKHENKLVGSTSPQNLRKQRQKGIQLIQKMNQTESNNSNSAKMPPKSQNTNEFMLNKGNKRKKNKKLTKHGQNMNNTNDSKTKVSNTYCPSTSCLQKSNVGSKHTKTNELESRNTTHLHQYFCDKGIPKFERTSKDSMGHGDTRSAFIMVDNGLLGPVMEQGHCAHKSYNSTKPCVAELTPDLKRNEPQLNISEKKMLSTKQNHDFKQHGPQLKVSDNEVFTHNFSKNKSPKDLPMNDRHGDLDNGIYADIKFPDRLLNNSKNNRPSKISDFNDHQLWSEILTNRINELQNAKRIENRITIPAKSVRADVKASDPKSRKIKIRKSLENDILCNGASKIYTKHTIQLDKTFGTVREAEPKNLSPRDKSLIAEITKTIKEKGKKRCNRTLDLPHKGECAKLPSSPETLPKPLMPTACSSESKDEVFVTPLSSLKRDCPNSTDSGEIAKYWEWLNCRDDAVSKSLLDDVLKQATETQPKCKARNKSKKYSRYKDDYLYFESGTTPKRRCNSTFNRDIEDTFSRTAFKEDGSPRYDLSILEAKPKKKCIEHCSIDHHAKGDYLRKPQLAKELQSTKDFDNPTRDRSSSKNGDTANPWLSTSKETWRTALLQGRVNPTSRNNASLPLSLREDDLVVRSPVPLDGIMEMTLIPIHDDNTATKSVGERHSEGVSKESTKSRRVGSDTDGASVPNPAINDVRAMLKGDKLECGFVGKTARTIHQAKSLDSNIQTQSQHKKALAREELIQSYQRNIKLHQSALEKYRKKLTRMSVQHKPAKGKQPPKCL